MSGPNAFVHLGDGPRDVEDDAWALLRVAVSFACGIRAAGGGGKHLARIDAERFDGDTDYEKAVAQRAREIVEAIRFTGGGKTHELAIKLSRD